MNVESQTVEQQEKIGMTDGDDRNELQPTCMRAFGFDKSIVDESNDQVEVNYLNVGEEVVAIKEEQWISVEDRLPDFDFGYCLAVRHHHESPEEKSVHYSFFIKDREYARFKNEYYSRKRQGKLSVHFDCAECGFVVTHWRPLPPPPVK